LYPPLAVSPVHAEPAGSLRVNGVELVPIVAGWPVLASVIVAVPAAAAA
jgi:hypothetical protein